MDLKRSTARAAVGLEPNIRSIIRRWRPSGTGRESVNFPGKWRGFVEAIWRD
jgi:hypothetical protein